MRDRCLLFLVMIMMTLSAWSDQAPVVVLLSDSEAVYEQPLVQFRSKLKRPVEVFNLKGDIQRAPEVMAEVMASKPGLIAAFGAKAAYFAKLATQSRQEVPVIFAMVLNWQRYRLLEGQDNLAGIDAEVAPGTQLLSMNLLFPDVTRLGVIYSNTHSLASVEEAISAAELVGVEISAEPIERAKELKQAYRRLAGKVNAVWLPTDPVLYTLENIHWLKRQCVKDRLICIGQSDNIVRLGLLLAVNPDIPSVGAQAAGLAEDILQHGVKPSQIGVQDPLGTRMTLNAKTASKIGLELTESVLLLADEVVE
ncbi:MAG: ABC transporter substrate binding protein [Candidatus Thiodiazotropha sp. 6PLUC2]